MAVLAVLVAMAVMVNDVASDMDLNKIPQALLSAVDCSSLGSFQPGPPTACRNLVEPSWGLVEPSWGLVEPSWGLVEPSWGLVEPSWGLV